MNYKNFTKRIILFSLAIASLCILFSCEETLPTYTAPTNVLGVNIEIVEQLNDHQAPPGVQAMHIVLTAENIHDEVFLDSVDIKGSIRIWWKRKPARYRTIFLDAKDMKDRALIHNGKLMLVPGQKVSFETFWNIKTDDSLYLAGTTEMDYTYARRRCCAPAIICSNPETFVMEVSINVYDRLGYVMASPKEFIFIGKAYSLGC